MKKPIGDPYLLKGNRLAFTDWHFVDPGSVGWYDCEGKIVGLDETLDPSEAFFRGWNCPYGIRLVVRKAQRIGPLFHEEMEWEKGGVTINTVIQDEKSYKAWGNTGWGSSLPGRQESMISYYESQDGYEWKRKDCGIIEFNGSKNNNLLCGPLFYGTVFLDPTSDNEHYKFVCEEVFAINKCTKCLESNLNAFSIEPEVFFEKDIFGLNKGVYGIRGAVSPNGVHWKILSNPLAITIADTQITAYYDTELKKYVIYSRSWAASHQAAAFNTKEYSTRWSQIGRRSISRTESEDFRCFPPPETIIEPSPQMLPNEVLYTNCRTAIPGAPEQHLMFPTVWNASGGDKTHLLLYASHDGKIWNMISTDPIMKSAEFGDWDGGCIFASPNLIELPNGDFALPYTGWNVPHKYPRMKARRNTGYALWPAGRITAVEAAENGEFTMVAIIPPADHLYINTVTKENGIVLVEACDIRGIPLPGRNFCDCEPVSGDHHRAKIKWKGDGRLGISSNEAVVLRFRMRKASLFNIEFGKY